MRWAGLLMLPGLLTVALGAERDSDGDGLPDEVESSVYHTDSQLADTDTDGLSDGQEVSTYFTLPLSADSDGDGFPSSL